MVTQTSQTTARTGTTKKDGTRKRVRTAKTATLLHLLLTLPQFIRHLVCPILVGLLALLVVDHLPLGEVEDRHQRISRVSDQMIRAN